MVMEDVTEEERSAEPYVSVHGGLDHTFLERGEGELSPFQSKSAKSYLMLPQITPEVPKIMNLGRVDGHIFFTGPRQTIFFTVPSPYMQKAGDSWDISPQIFLDFLQNFRLRTRNQYCTQAIA